jgi:hypothetical protein
MNKQEIDNLTLIVKEQYAHICVHPNDLSMFLNVPIQKKNYYECINRAARLIGKKGFLNGGKTTIWTDWACPYGHVKIATKQPYEMTIEAPSLPPTLVYYGPSSLTKGWSDPMSYREPDSVLRIQKLMKLKAFW